jgi:hypothetical protein
MNSKRFVRKELSGFFKSGRRTIFVYGGSETARHEVASEIARETLGNYFVQEFGDPNDFRMAEPYLIYIRPTLREFFQKRLSSSRLYRLFSTVLR